MTDEFKKPTFKCSRYKNGKLYMFTRKKITVVKMTPYGPVAWSKSEVKPSFTPCRLPNDLDVGWAMRDSAMTANNDDQHPYCRFHINPQIKFFREKFDQSLLKKSQAFPSHNLDMYKMLMLNGAVELAESNPALAFMIALNRVFCPKKVARPWCRAKAMLKMKRRKILSMCGFPESESLVRIFSRIGRMTVKDIFFLRSALNRKPELLRTLSFVDSYSRMVFTFATLPALSDNITFQFLNEVEQIDYSNTCKCESLMRDTIRMSSSLGESVGRLRSIKDLQHRHDELIVPYILRMKPDIGKNSFPELPVPVPPPGSNFEIYPIDTPLKLYKEGCEQHNCVYTYCDEIAKGNGKTYIYSLIKPERATVKIRSFPAIRYIIDEIQGPCNRSVSAVTVDAVKRWLTTFSEPAMTTDLYEIFCEIEKIPEFDLPSSDDGNLTVLHELSPGYVFRLLSDFKVDINEELLLNIKTGKTYVLEMFEPGKGLLLVMRNGYGWSWSFTSCEGSEYVCHQAQELIDEWIEKVAVMNFPTDIPGQMYFELEKTEAV